MLTVNIQKLRDDAVIPNHATEGAAGCDLRACLDAPVYIMPGESVMFTTGLAFEIPEGYAGFIFARSGMAAKQGLRPATCVSVIDSDYRGECYVPLRNDSDTPRLIHPGDRIAQIVILAYNHVRFNETESLHETNRGAGGFGSTGTN